MQDALGNEIVVGDMVVYPGRQDSFMWMNYGRVVECVEGELNPHAVNNYGFEKWLKHPSIRVRKQQTNYRDDTVGEQVVRVTKMDRMVVVPHSQFSDTDREFFGLGDS